MCVQCMCGEGAGGSGRERVEDTAARRRTAIISTPLIPRNRSARIILFFVGYGVAKAERGPVAAPGSGGRGIWRPGGAHPSSARRSFPRTGQHSQEQVSIPRNRSAFPGTGQHSQEQVSIPRNSQHSQEQVSRIMAHNHHQHAAHSQEQVSSII
jgi:hypothetical protein